MAYIADIGGRKLNIKIDDIQTKNHWPRYANTEIWNHGQKLHR